MTEPVTLNLNDVGDLTRRVLLACGTGSENAESVVASVIAAEADGIHSHGLARLPTYAEHVLCGKVDGAARPTVARPRPGAVVADALGGFAHPAIDLGLPELVAAARECGVAAMSVTNSYNCGVVGYHVERLADHGLLALAFVNGPAAIAPWGGKKGLFGTDPIAIACPRAGGSPLVIDQSSSVIAKKRGHGSCPEGRADSRRLGVRCRRQHDHGCGGSPERDHGADGWTQGRESGHPYRTDGRGSVGRAFSVSRLPVFGGNEGGPPRTGQCFLAFDTSAFSEGFTEHAEDLFAAILDQPGTRLPGDRRLAGSCEDFSRRGFDFVSASREIGRLRRANKCRIGFVAPIGSSAKSERRHRLFEKVCFLGRGFAAQYVVAMGKASETFDDLVVPERRRQTRFTLRAVIVVLDEGDVSDLVVQVFGVFERQI